MADSSLSVQEQLIDDRGKPNIETEFFEGFTKPQFHEDKPELSYNIESDIKKVPKSLPSFALEDSSSSSDGKHTRIKISICEFCKSCGI